MILAHQRMRLGKMAKISESYKFEDDKLIIKKTHDANEMLKDVEHARNILIIALVLIISTLVMSIWHYLACG